MINKSTKRATRAISMILSIFLFINLNALPALAQGLYEDYLGQARWQKILSMGGDVTKNTLDENSSGAGQAGDLKDKQNPGDKEYQTNRFIIKYKDENKISTTSDTASGKTEDENQTSTTPDTASGKSEDENQTSTTPDTANGKIEKPKTKGKKSNFAVITTDKKMTAKDFAAGFAHKNSSDAIEYIQPDYEMAIASSDPLLDDQWGHYQMYWPPNIYERARMDDGTLLPAPAKSFSVSEGPGQEQEAYRLDANVLEAWTDTKGQGTLIAVLDTGIDITHEDLAGNIWINPGEIPGNGLDDDGDGYIDDVNGWDFCNKDNTPDDQEWKYDQWHGTHIAGIIAAQDNNDAGIAGVAPEAKILPLKVFQGGTAYTSDIIEAIQYAEAMGAQIVNASWGSLYENQALQDVISDSSMLFVCAAGNRLYNLDNTPFYPAAYSKKMDNVIAVASLNNDGRLSRFSNYGPKTVDIAAPGERIISTWLDGAYNMASGTSMAAGYVSGSAALLLAKNTDMTAAQIKQRVVQAGDQVTGLQDKVKDGKKLNCGYAVSDFAAPNTEIIGVPDGSMPEMRPDGTSEQEYELANAENYIDIKADMPTARHGLGVVAVNGKIYAIGGQTTTSSGYSNKVEEYDPATNTWVAKANMPRTRSYFGCEAVNGKIYAIGGYNGSYLNYVDVYDPATNTWSTKTNRMPVSMRAFTATAHGDKIYVLGGYNGSYRNTIYEYDTSADTWTQKANLLTARSEHAAFSDNGKIYISGGGNSQLLKSTEVYDIAQDTVTSMPWLVRGLNTAAVKTNERIITIGGLEPGTGNYSTVIMSKSLNQPNSHFFSAASMMFARGAMGTVLLNGKVYMIGGRNASSIFSLVEEMDLGWVDKGELPLRTMDSRSIALNGKLYTFGGLTDDNGELMKTKSVYEYDPATAQWQQKADMPEYLRDYALTTAYGKIYLISGLRAWYPEGNEWNDFSDRVYEYDPGKNIWTEKEYYGERRAYLSAVFWNGEIYVVGGWNLDGEYANVEAYEPINGDYRIMADLPEMSYLNYMTVLDNQIYLISGSNAKIYTYDGSQDLWQTRYEGCNWSNYTDIVVNLYDTIYDFKQNANTIATIEQYHYTSNAVTFYNTFNFFGQLLQGALLDNKIYLFTGSNEFANRLVEYTPPVTPWVSKKSPDQSSAGSGSAVIDNNIYLIGGRSESQVLNRMEMYDPFSDSWQNKAPMNYKRHSLGISVANGRIYAIGGRDDTAQALNYVEEYNPLTNTWTTKAPIPAATSAMAIAEANGKIYIFGGYNSSISTVNAVREYDPATNTWTNKANMPSARYGAGAATINGKIYVAGGSDSSHRASNTLYVYDPAANTWTTKAAMPTSRSLVGAVARDSLYIIGGTDGVSERREVHEYSPVLDKWFSWSGPNIARYAMAVSILEEGLYVVNGTDNFYCYAMTEFAPLASLYAEYIHMGKAEVNLSGNFSRTYTDMEIPAPGFNIKATRTYNSRDERTTGNLISKGWTVGFQGKLDVSGNDTIVRLPDGSGQTFRQKTDGAYVARDSRSTLVKQPDNTHILTTKDQYTYGFNTNGYLIWMKDKNGNAVNFTVNASGQVTNVTDQAGRSFTISYSSGRISRITDPAGRIVTYTYTSGLLSRVTDPNGYNTHYTYDSQGYLNSVKDHNNNIIETIEYSKPAGEELYKVKKITLKLGNVESYEYNNSEGCVTVTDSNNRQTRTWYDKSLYPIRTQDAEGKQTRTMYNLEGGLNKYGEEQRVVDRNGNTTLYDRDGRGNITRITNPDESYKLFEYDQKNNLTSVRDEWYRYTLYVYDSQGINLLEKKQPLNNYPPEEGEPSEFATTRYTYYTAAEAQAQFGRSIAGLLKTETDPLGNVTTYYYDNRGYITGVKDALNHTISYQYNIIGWLKQKTTPRSHTTKYYYDKNGRLLKQVQHGGETERFLYDYLGNVTKRVLPKQYTAASDTTTFTAENIVNAAGGYTPDHGHRYTYDTKGLLTSEKDPLGFSTAYTYDIYGNKTQETKPNGAVYMYEYDVMNRLVKTSFKENAAEPAVLLEENSYGILSDGKTTQGRKQYFNDTDYAETILTYDYARRPVRQDNPDGSYTTTRYYDNGVVRNQTDALGRITYHFYDSLNRRIGTWSPLTEQNGEILYAYTGMEYNNAGWVTREVTSEKPVRYRALPAAGDQIWTAYAYYADGKVREKTNSTGAKTVYEYDDDGNLRKEEQYTSGTQKNITEYTYNHLPKITEKRVYVQKHDIYGQPENTDLIALTSAYTYDPNGNTLTSTDPNNITTTHTYDQMNRLLTTSKPGSDEQGAAVTITTGSTYDWAGNALTRTNENGWTTTYTYDQRSFLAKVTDALNGVTFYAYDLAGRKTAEVLPKHYNAGSSLNQMNRTGFVYDKMGRLQQKIYSYITPGGSEYSHVVAEAYEYDANGNMIYKQDAGGYTGDYGTEYTYDIGNRLISELDPVGKERGLTFSLKYGYDALGRKTSETDAAGAATTYVYNDQGNLLSTHTNGIMVQSSTYDLVGNALTRTDGNGSTTTITYNALNLPRQQTLPGDGSIAAYTVNYKYTRTGLLARQKDSLEQERIYTYDHQGRRLTETERHANQTSPITHTARYDKRGNIRFQIDGNGNITETVYDKLDRPTLNAARGTNPQGLVQSTAYTYDANSNRLTETDRWGNTYTFAYDPLDRLIEKKDPYNKRIEKLVYNDNNIQVASMDALDNTTEFRYDKNNRLLETEDPVSNITAQTYDNAGNINSKTDGRGNTTIFTYDALKRLTAVENALGEITAYTYDNAGNLLTQTDGNGNTTTFAYNVRNLPVRKVDNGGITQENGVPVYDPARTETYGYRADGKQQQKTDRNGVQSQYTYDIHARLTLEAVGADTISYTYDNNHNQLTVTDSTGTITRTYDALNRVLTKTVPVLGTSIFTYDLTAGLPAGHVGSSTTDPKGNTVTQIMDKAGRLHQVKDGSTVTATYTYYDNGNLQKLQYPGSSEEYTYYPNNQLHTLVNKTGGSILEAYSYIYDEAGNQTQKIDAKGTTDYTYDELNRLLSVTEPDDYATVYTFDASGNRLSEIITYDNNTFTINYTYNGQNRLIQTETIMNSGAILGTAFTYDNNGNMLGRLQSMLKDVPEGGAEEINWLFQLEDDSGQDAIYEYDVRNRLVRVTQSENIIENTYNAEGLRIAKTTNGQTLRYLYEYDRIILETDDSGNVIARNIWGTNLLRRSADGQSLDYMYNGHADVTALVSGSTVIAGYYYDAFGLPVEEINDANNPYRYAGYEYDAEVSLYNLKARFYDASIARFLQEDTYRGNYNDPLSLNLYTYCANNPLVYYDPTGHTHVYGNAIDLANARATLGSGYTYVDTSLSSWDGTVRPGSIVVGGTGAEGGVGTNVDIGGSVRIWGDTRTETANALNSVKNSNSINSSIDASSQMNSYYKAVGGNTGVNIDYYSSKGGADYVYYNYGNAQSSTSIAQTIAGYGAGSAVSPNPTASINSTTSTGSYYTKGSGSSFTIASVAGSTYAPTAGSWLDDIMSGAKNVAGKAVGIAGEVAGKVATKVTGVLGGVILDLLLNPTPTSSNDMIKIKTTTDSKLPLYDEPDSITQRVDENGDVVQERYYDSNGRAFKDKDYTNHGNPKKHPEVPHEHNWDWSNPNSPVRK